MLERADLLLEATQMKVENTKDIDTFENKMCLILIGIPSGAWKSTYNFFNNNQDDIDITGHLTKHLTNRYKCLNS